MDFYIDLVKELDVIRAKELEALLARAESNFCILTECQNDEYKKLKQLVRSVKKPVRKGTFIDCARKLPSELKEHYEKRKQYEENGFGGRGGRGDRGGFRGGDRGGYRGGGRGSYRGRGRGRGENNGDFPQHGGSDEIMQIKKKGFEVKRGG